ncbi:hypothetical protein [Solidesulfovibrio sp.]|uniref:nucleotide-binding protein n=1 Tax=Solidesulfovibrio sp. TaxID=2910990 RepID=UPI0026063410|nr:hypothetical protein [Solidesulfovibrio sp.]
MKRAIFIMSQKGGSGKTTFSRALLDHLRYGLGLGVAAFDADGQVGQLLQYYGARDGEGRLAAPQDPLTGVGVFDLRRREERGTVVDALDLGAQTLLFDFPAGCLGDLTRVVGEGGISPVLDEYEREGYRTTVAVVVSNVQTSADNVLAAMAVFRDRVDYVAVKNLFYGKPEDFLFFDGFTGADGRRYGGQAREALARAGGRLVEMPALPGREYALCDMYCLGFSEAKAHPALRRAERAAVGHFQREFGAAIAPAGPLLGCAPSTPQSSIPLNWSQS